MLLLKFPWPGGNAVAALASVLSRSGQVLRVYRALTVTDGKGVDADEGYAYVGAAGVDFIDASALETFEESLAARVPGVTAARLEPLLQRDGATYGEDAPYHYIVETHVLPESEADFNAWYDEEHLPGLAAVPGTVRAARFVNLDEARRYHACYDLISIETLSSPRWLAVRQTPWSGRVRPAFRNTKRTLFRRIDAGI